MIPRGAVATATFRDTWSGDLLAFLVPQRTTRRGARVVVYRWMTERGSTCDGLAHGHGSRAMVTTALRNPFFSNVAVLLTARNTMEKVS